MDRLGIITFQRCQELAHAGTGRELTDFALRQIQRNRQVTGELRQNHQNETAAALTTAADFLHS